MLFYFIIRCRVHSKFWVFFVFVAFIIHGKYNFIFPVINSAQRFNYTSCQFDAPRSTMIFTVMSRERHGVTNHQPLEWLCIGLFSLTLKTHSIGPLWREFTGDWYISIPYGDNAESFSMSCRLQVLSCFVATESHTAAPEIGSGIGVDCIWSKDNHKIPDKHMWRYNERKLTNDPLPQRRIP